MTVQAHLRRLRDDVHAVAIDDDAVFLDVARDTYACVPGAAKMLVLDEARRVRAVADAAFTEVLDAAGLLAPPEARLSGQAWPVVRPGASAMTGPFAPPRWPDALEGARSLLDLSRCYYRQPLSRLLDWAEAGATEAGSDPMDAATADLVAAFHRWSPYLPAPGKCLLRSFTLLRLLRRHGQDARWVFGVRTWPFRAHCWLQRGDTVLDDDVEALVALTPIHVA